MSEAIARIEQVLFFLAAIIGDRSLFGSVIEGWAILKAISSYALWMKNKEAANATDAAIAHNRVQIFIVGTGMSIAAGGLAGIVYHLVLHLLA